MCRIICGVVLAVLAAACGGGAERATTTAAAEAPATVAIPTPEQLAAELLTPEDLGGEWACSDVDGDGRGDPFGVITEEMRGLLPGFGFCPEAGPEAETVAAEVKWQAFTQIEFSGQVEGVEGLPDPVISVQEFLVAGDPAQVAEWFRVLAAAAVACSGVAWETEDGTLIRSESLPVPTVGDSAFGEYASIPVPGARRWDIRSVTVVEDSVLMVVTEGEAGIGGDADTVVDQEDLDRIVTTACDKLSA